MRDVYEALRRIEAQLAAMDGRLGTVERAITTTAGASR
jgi:hypothetical protein